MKLYNLTFQRLCLVGAKRERMEKGERVWKGKQELFHCLVDDRKLRGRKASPKTSTPPPLPSPKFSSVQFIPFCFFCLPLALPRILGFVWREKYSENVDKKGIYYFALLNPFVQICYSFINYVIWAIWQIQTKYFFHSLISLINQTKSIYIYFSSSPPTLILLNFLNSTYQVFITKFAFIKEKVITVIQGSFDWG